MITSYFLIHFLQTASIYFTVLLGLFLSCNIVIKMPIIHHAGILPALIMLLLPVMTLFALPLASSMAVYITVAEHKDRDELVVISFLAKGMQSLRYSVVLYGFLCSILYAIFAFYLAPQGYVLSKRLFLNVAKEQFLHVEPGVFHTTIPTVSFYVQKKKLTADNQTLFEKLILVLRKKNTEQLFITANSGFFDDRQLVLHDGHLISYKNGPVHTAFFKKTAIQLDAYISPPKEKSLVMQTRFLTVNTLWRHAAYDQEMFFELHKRIAQTGWQFILILLAFAYVLIRKKSSLLSCVLMCGMTFLATYLIISLAQSYVHQSSLCLGLLYGPLLAAFMVSVVIIFKRRDRV